MNNRDEIVLKKIIQYADEIGITIERLNLTQDIFANDFIAKKCHFYVCSSDWRTSR